MTRDDCSPYKKSRALHSSAMHSDDEGCRERLDRSWQQVDLLATVEDDSPAAAQPLRIGGSVPGESASTDTDILPDKVASEEAVSLAAEAGQPSADAHPEGLAAGAAYGGQVEVNTNSVAKSADSGRYTPRLGKACDLCHQNRLKCTMPSTGCCDQCTVRGIECKRRMEGRRGRPRVTAENIVQLVQRRNAAREQQLPGGASGRVRNASAREIGAVPQTGAFPSFHDPDVQAAFAAGIQAGTQAVMMQFHGQAHPCHSARVTAPFHMSPVSPMFNGAATAVMAGQYGVGGMDGSAAYQQYANEQYAAWYAAMYAHFQQQQQQQEQQEQHQHQQY